MLCGSNRKIKNISMQEAYKALQADASIIVLDVRTEAEYRSGHIPGSINRPVETLTSLEDVVPSKTDTVFVYCLSGCRSDQACARFIRQGYTGLINIGGMFQWPGHVEKGE